MDTIKPVPEKTLFEFKNFVEERQKKYGSLLAFSITNSCPLKCKHCIVDANSSYESITDVDYNFYLNQILNLNKRIEQISITGGEPFYVPEKLKIFERFCSANKIQLGVVTSAYWATSLGKAEEIINKFEGISHYSISTDKYHLKYVSIKSIRNAYLKAKYLGKKIVIRVSGETEESIKYNSELYNIYKFVDKKEEIVFQRLLPFGRAKINCKDSFIYVDKPSHIPCLSNAPVIRENGIVEPCCGSIISLQGKHPLVLGNVLKDDISNIFLKIKTNWLFNYIRLWGLNDFIEIIEKSHLKNKLPKKYLQDDICTTCCALFSDCEISEYLFNLSNFLSFRLKVALGLYYYLDDVSSLNYIKETYDI